MLIQNGKILIQGGVNDTVFSLLGGHVAWGETSAEAIVREYKEETGADIEAGRLVWVDESTISCDDLTPRGSQYTLNQLITVKKFLKIYLTQQNWQYQS